MAPRHRMSATGVVANAAAAEETPSGELCSIKCPSCFKRNKYHRGTERLMCHACKTTFRVPS